MILETALFTYTISKQKNTLFPNNFYFRGMDCWVNYTSKTDVVIDYEADRCVLILGLCVDAYAEISREIIVKEILKVKGNIVEIYRKCDRLAGKYVILYYDGEFGYIWGDATSSIPINYGFADDNNYCMASTDKLAADCLGYSGSEQSKKIRDGSSLEQPMPGALTLYEGIFALLPNHYLDLRRKKAVRVPLDICKADDLPSIIDRSLSLIKGIVCEYSRYYDLVCPLTSGYDSRVVYSFLKADNPQVQCYTFKHKGFSASTDDMYVPQSICKAYNQPYRVVEDLQVSDEDMFEVAYLLGEYIDRGTVSLAKTFDSVFRGQTLVNGDIIDQVGKSLIGNAVPPSLATGFYFLCKIHNYEAAARTELENYIREIEETGEREYVFDLFAIESRCGRWAAQREAVYSICGVPSLNIFNCRELILMWFSVPRNFRSRMWIHKQFFLRNDERLLRFPFNPSGQMTNFLKQNWILFYIATYLKWILAYLKRKIKHS